MGARVLPFKRLCMKDDATPHYIPPEHIVHQQEERKHHSDKLYHHYGEMQLAGYKDQLSQERRTDMTLADKARFHYHRLWVSYHIARIKAIDNETNALIGCRMFYD